MAIVSLPHSSPEYQGTSCAYSLQVGTQKRYRIQNNILQDRLCLLWGFKERAVNACNFAYLHIKNLIELVRLINSEQFSLICFYRMKHIKLEKVLNFDFFSKNEDQYRILQPIKLSRLYVYL